MNITPRKAEVDPIVALLESDQYDDARALAGAIVKQAYESLLEREWYLTVVKLGETEDGRVMQAGYGLAPSKAQALALELGGDSPRMVLPITSAKGHITRMAALETPPKKTVIEPVRRARKGKQ